jgi:hypothetical protein
LYYLCRGNPCRSNGNNLFHYCLNEHVNGLGSGNQEEGARGLDALQDAGATSRDPIRAIASWSARSPLPLFAEPVVPKNACTARCAG